MNEPQDELRYEPVEPEGPAAIAEWRSRVRAAGLFLLAFVCAIVANIVGGLLGQKIAGSHVLAADMLYRVLTTVTMIGLYALMLRYLEHERGSKLAAMGLPFRKGAGREYLVGFGLGLGLITLAVIAIALFGHVEMHMRLTAITERRFVEVTFLLLFGAIMEELMFRGYPFQRLMAAIGPVGAILVFSALFGAGHLKNPNAGGLLSWGFFNTIAVGVVFSVAYLKFRTLWLPWGLHFGWNFALGVIYGLPVSGISDFSVIVRSSATGSNLLTGGAYGIEASLTGAVVIVIGLLVIIALPGPKIPVLLLGAESPVRELRPEHPGGI